MVEGGDGRKFALVTPLRKWILCSVIWVRVRWDIEFSVGLLLLDPKSSPPPFLAPFLSTVPAPLFTPGQHDSSAYFFSLLSTICTT